MKRFILGVLAIFGVALFMPPTASACFQCGYFEGEGLCLWFPESGARECDEMGAVCRLLLLCDTHGIPPESEPSPPSEIATLEDFEGPLLQVIDQDDSPESTSTSSCSGGVENEPMTLPVITYSS